MSYDRLPLNVYYYSGAPNTLGVYPFKINLVFLFVLFFFAQKLGTFSIKEKSGGGIEEEALFREKW